MSGTDKIARDITNLTVPVGKLGGLVTLLVLCGAAGYQINENAENAEHNRDRIEDQGKEITGLKVDQAVVATQYKEIMKSLEKIESKLP